MPAVACRHDHRGARTTGDFQRGFRFRLHEHFRFHGLPLLVEPVKLHSDAICRDGIVQCQQSRAKSGVADAPARIDTRPDQVTQMEDIEGLSNPRDAGKRRKADIAL